MSNDEPQAGMAYELELARKRIAELEGARAKDDVELERLRTELHELSDQYIGNSQRLMSVCDNWHNWAVEIVGKESARKMSGQDMRNEILRRLAGLDRAPTAQAEPTVPLPNEKQRGIYRKFRVERTDGSSGPGGKHERCEYFVLDWMHDKFAVPAARAYADACSREFPELARDLRATANDAETLHQPAAQAEAQDEGPYDGLTSTATACHNCPTKLPPEWRVRLSTGMSPGYHEYSLVCCMCGRATEWTKDWRGLKDWWCTNNPALPDGTKHRPADREGGGR